MKDPCDIDLQPGDLLFSASKGGICTFLSCPIMDIDDCAICKIVTANGKISFEYLSVCVSLRHHYLQLHGEQNANV